MIPLVVIATGVIITFHGVRGVVRAKRSVDWPTVGGEVLSSSIGRKGGTEREYERKTREKTAAHHALIRYEYTVDGRTFNGKRVSYGDYGSRDLAHAQGIVKRYRKGKSVTVYYMPENPQECLLEFGLKGKAWVWPGAGFGVLIIGFLMIWRMLTAYKAKSYHW